MRMTLSNAFVAFLLLGGVMVGMYSFIGDMTSESTYNLEFDSGLQAQLDKTSEIEDKINESYAEIQEWTSDKASTIGVITFVIDAIKLGINMITLPFTMVWDTIEIITSVLKLPDWATSIILTTLIAMLIFGLLALIMRFKGT